MTREEAIAEGLSQYRGTPCHRGHDGMRYVASNSCITCTRQRDRDKRKQRAVAPGFNGHTGSTPKNIGERIAKRNTRKPLSLPQLRQADVEPLMVPLIELKHNSCRYPYDRDVERGYLFCGLTKMSSTPYCPEHTELSYIPPDRVRQRKLMRLVSVIAPSSMAA